MKNRTFFAAMFASVIACALPIGGQAIAQSTAAPVGDETIVTSVKATLASKPELKASNLKVTSKNGDITISGPVESGHQLYLIADAAQKVAGVKSVYNEMFVKN